MKKHTSVLFQESIEALNIKPNGFYIDATFGRGGHSRGILEKLDENGKLLAIDQDPEAIKAADEIKDKRFSIKYARFDEIDSICEQIGWVGKVDGILMDLGVSSPQLDDAQRGFSFSKEGPLDMRMDPNKGIPASKWLEEADEQEIAKVLFEYGEERLSRKIAKVIKQKLPIKTTTELANIIQASYPAKLKVKHNPATRSFQAIRIHINQEFKALEEALQKTTSLLTSKGRLAVITFHSLEDRIVKRFIKKTVSVEQPPAKLPIKHEDICPKFKSLGKLKPSKDEIEQNKRARSSTLRVMEKL